MHAPTLLRLFASLCLLLLLALPGCGKANAPAPVSAPGGRGAPPPSRDSGSAEAPSVARLGTHADFNHSPSPDPAPAPADAGGYGGYDYDDSPQYEPQADYEESAITSNRQARRHNPGLGTSYGENHFSQVTTAPFTRGSSNPDVLLSLWYNDEDGIRQAQGAYGSGFGQTSQVSTGDGVFVVSVVDEYGYAMSAAQVGNKRYVVGQPGQRYKLRVQNNSPYRYEVVASVDGLDVIDGQSASFAKRGYIIAPWSSITVDGWRTSEQSVAAFRFSSMEESYAGRKGQARNIGVVGFAFFHERGGPSWEELQRRDSADPFPSRFAQPPPRRWRR